MTVERRKDHTEIRPVRHHNDLLPGLADGPIVLGHAGRLHQPRRDLVPLLHRRRRRPRPELGARCQHLPQPRVDCAKQLQGAGNSRVLRKWEGDEP